MSAPALDLAGAVEALGTGNPTVAVRGACALVWVEGPDAPRFLQGLLTNDVDALAPATGQRSLLLDAKGHILVALGVHRDDEHAFTLVCDPPAGDALMELLERYHFSEDLELIGPEPSAMVTVPGRPAVVDGPVVPGAVPGTMDLVVADATACLAQLGADELPAEALEILRVERGAPRVGVDTGERTLVQEAALEDVAVSFTKGCYLGQETVARARHRGRVNRILRGVAAAVPLSPGAEVRAGDGPVGTVTSAVHSPSLGPIGLAIIRREVGPGAEVTVEGIAGVACVRELPFR